MRDSHWSTWCGGAHNGSNGSGRCHGCRKSHLCFASIPGQQKERTGLVERSRSFLYTREQCSLLPEEGSGGPLWNLSVTSSIGTRQDQRRSTSLLLLNKVVSQFRLMKTHERKKEWKTKIPCAAWRSVQSLHFHLQHSSQISDGVGLQAEISERYDSPTGEQGAYV